MSVETLFIILFVSQIVILVVAGLMWRRINRLPADSGDKSVITAFKEETARIEQAFRTETNTMRTEADERGKRLREEVGNRIQGFVETVQTRIENLSRSNEERQEALRKTVEGRLDKLREENTKKLEDMQRVVDEKLEGTLEKQLGKSFKLVSERLEQVHKGLGEMQNLATGVGDLKRVLTNVKTQGTWAEIQLGMLLDDILTKEQYIENARVDPNSRENVEFAIRLPGKDADDSEVLLPIDAKFPQKDFENLRNALDSTDRKAIEAAQKSLERSIKEEAKSIFEKYIKPPHTTNFAILYLPTEGLFAEVIRCSGLMSELQRKYRVTVTGPTTLAALLNSLQMGFRTLAIQKHSSEVWKVLEKAKAEFKKYGDVWDKVHEQLTRVSNTVEKVSVRTRAVERTLQNVGTSEIAEQEIKLLPDNEEAAE